jgi:hypothetical protein
MVIKTYLPHKPTHTYLVEPATVWYVGENT